MQAHVNAGTCPGQCRSTSYHDQISAVPGQCRSVQVQVSAGPRHFTSRSGPRHFTSRSVQVQVSAGQCRSRSVQVEVTCSPGQCRSRSGQVQVSAGPSRSAQVQVSAGPHQVQWSRSVQVQVSACSALCESQCLCTTLQIDTKQTPSVTARVGRSRLTQCKTDSCASPRGKLGRKSKGCRCEDLTQTSYRNQRPLNIEILIKSARQLQEELEAESTNELE